MLGRTSVLFKRAIKLSLRNRNTTTAVTQHQKVRMSSSLERLQQILVKESLAYYIVPSEDQHQSEYIAPQDKRREFISKFSGSAGLAVVIADQSKGHNRLFTDGRYYLQAEQQLDLSKWTLMKTEGPSLSAWLGQTVQSGEIVGVDPRLISLDSFQEIEKSLSPNGASLKAVWENLVDKVWDNKPIPSKEPAIVLPVSRSGRTVEDKLNTIRSEMKSTGVGCVVLSALDEIAWLLNVRGTGDIAYNPVVISYVLITADKVHWFVDQDKVTQQVKDHLGSAVTIHPYESFFDELKGVSGKIWMDGESSYSIYTACDKTQIVLKRSPITFMKALKNDTEIAGFKACHIRDGAAQVEFFAWLEAELKGGNDKLTEHGVALKQIEFRKKQQDYMGPSFETISSVGPNAAIIHYSPPESGGSILDINKIYLNDSGSQFMDGTTDVTRTWHFGKPSAKEKDAFTRVLKGVLGLGAAVFPKGTTGEVIDVLARRALWEAGLDYAHGTGHGVGHFLNVHEWPPRVSCTSRGLAAARVPLEPRMVLSNEPGYYLGGEFGIRIEDLMFVKEIKVGNGAVPFYTFETLTMVPIDVNLIDLDLLDAKEKKLLNEYHQRVWDNVSPLLIASKSSALEWLKARTAAI